MMPRRVLTWPEHKKLLQKRHGADAPRVPGKTRHIRRHGDEGYYPYQSVPISYNKVIYCGLAAVEMALEIVRNQWPKEREGLDLIYTLVRDMSTDPYKFARSRYQEVHELLIDSYEETFHSRSSLLLALYHLILSVRKDHSPPSSWGMILHDTWMAAYSPAYATLPSYPNPSLQDWAIMVEARCAQRLAFTSPGSSNIEMKPPPLLEY